MYYTPTMSANFESEKNKKAFAYTVLICGALLLIAFLVSWTHKHTPSTVVQDLIEINLGNNTEGYGEVQPLVKGEKSPGEESAEQPKAATVKTAAVEETKTDDVADKESAPVTKPEKTTVKVKTPEPVVTPAPKPQKPKIAGYSGPKNGTGNGANEDNGYKYQGNNPNGKGDAGNPNGKPDSYGNNPGGKTGGSLRVIGDRTIVNNYIFMGDLPRATINAKIKVSKAGKGEFTGFAKGSTSTDSKYVNKIKEILPNIEFNKADHESDVIVPFNFREQ